MEPMESVEMLRQLATAYKTVQDAFADAVEGFNAEPKDPLWQKLASVLDDEAVVIGVDHHTKVATGKTGVLTFLGRPATPEKPGASFTPSQVNPPVIGRKTAFIGGIAAWHDNDGDRDGDIQFVFGFVNRGSQATLIGIL